MRRPRATCSPALSCAPTSICRTASPSAACSSACWRSADVLELTRGRYSAGLDTQVEVKQAESSLAAGKVELTQVETTLAQLRNQVAALAGAGPQRGQSLTETALVAPAGGVPASVPLDLLGRRPDVVAARWRAEAARHAIDTAKAEFYPNINLTAFAGFQAMGTGNLLDAASRMAGIGPAISLPIFHGGALNANLAGRRADATWRSRLQPVRAGRRAPGGRCARRPAPAGPGTASSARRAPPSRRLRPGRQALQGRHGQLPVGADRADGRADPGPPRHRPAHPRLPAGRRLRPTHWAAATHPPRPPPLTPSPRSLAPPLTDRPGFRRHERSATNPARKRLLLLATGAFVLIAIAYGIWWALFGAHFENTDDAYVHGNLVQITPQVLRHHRRHRGRRHRNRERRPAAGASRFRRHRRGAATGPGKLAQTVRQVRTYYVQNDALAADVDLRSADIVRAQAELACAQSDVSRRQQLAKSGGVSGEEIPARRSRAEVRAVRPGPGQGRAGRRARKLATNQALTRAPTWPGTGRAAGRRRPAQCLAGAIAHRAARAGRWRGGAPQRPGRPAYAPGAALMTVVPLDQVWVEANFKEGQLRKMRIGQPCQDECRPVRHLGDHGTIAGLMPAPAAPSRCCPHRTPRATGSRWCSACPCASRSIPRT